MLLLVRKLDWGKSDRCQVHGMFSWMSLINISHLENFRSPGLPHHTIIFEGVCKEFRMNDNTQKTQCMQQSDCAAQNQPNKRIPHANVFPLDDIRLAPIAYPSFFCILKKISLLHKWPVLDAVSRSSRDPNLEIIFYYGQCCEFGCQTFNFGNWQSGSATGNFSPTWQLPTFVSETLYGDRFYKVQGKNSFYVTN